MNYFLLFMYKRIVLSNWSYLNCILPLAASTSDAPLSTAHAATFLVVSTVACTVLATDSNKNKLPIIPWIIKKYFIYMT